MWLVATRLGSSDYRTFPVWQKVPLDSFGIEGWRFRDRSELRTLDQEPIVVTVQGESVR